MARATPTVVVPVFPDGAVLALTAPTLEGDAVPAGSVLVVNNGSGAPITITFVTGGTYDGLAIDDQTMTVAAGVQRAVGPVPGGNEWVQSSGATKGLVHVDFSAVGTVTRAYLH